MNTLLLYLTYNCNLNCSYCFQFHPPGVMSFLTAQKGVDLLLSSEADEVNLDFYGGEPFLHFGLMMDIITYAASRAYKERKRISFRTTTNGTLLSDKELKFLSKYGVDITLSIDGTQRAHDACRGHGSFNTAIAALDELKKYPLCSTTVNSVISPGNVRYFAESMKYLIERKNRHIHISFDYDTVWDDFQLQELKHQYANLYDFVINYYREKHKIPLSLFRIRSIRKQPNRCTAGSDAFAVTPQGDIYGCRMFVPISKKAKQAGYLNHFTRLCLGNVSESLAISQLRRRAFDKQSLFPRSQDEFRTEIQECAHCDFVRICEACPADALSHSDDGFTIPACFCEISKLKHTYRQKIYKQVYEREKSSVWNIIDWPE